MRFSNWLAIGCVALLVASMHAAASGLAFAADGAMASPVVPAFERFSGSPDADKLHLGRILLGELNCTSCHDAAEELDHGILPKAAPILDAIGGRARPEYLREFLLDPHRVKPGTTMPKFLSHMDEAARSRSVEALVHYLASTGTVSDASISGKAIADGHDLFHEVGCAACHDSPEEGATPIGTSVPLARLAEK